MKFLVVFPNKSKQDPLVLEGLSYIERLRAPFYASTLFIGSKNTSLERRIEQEGEELLRHTEGYFRIALDPNGKQYPSEQFAKKLLELEHRTSKIAFIIGGAFGLSEDVLKKSDILLSLSSMTLPHRLAFLVLSEQLYRASEIRIGSQYHK